VVQRPFRSDYSGAFGFFAYTIFGFALLLAFSVFLYGRVLAADKIAKDKVIAQEVAKIDPKTVETFVRLRDRLTSSQALLESHVAFSNFFAALEKIMPTTVRFTSLHITFVAGTPTVEGVGVAKSFNALAAASEAFAADGRVKDAIFSKLTVSTSNNSVSFALSATLDPRLIAYTP
jgi:Fe-S-cluster formation regulator IscX/YfhJ